MVGDVVPECRAFVVESDDGFIDSVVETLVVQQDFIHHGIAGELVLVNVLVVTAEVDLRSPLPAFVDRLLVSVILGRCRLVGRFIDPWDVVASTTAVTAAAGGQQQGGGRGSGDQGGPRPAAVTAAPYR